MEYILKHDLIGEIKVSKEKYRKIKKLVDENHRTDVKGFVRNPKISAVKVFPNRVSLRDILVKKGIL